MASQEHFGPVKAEIVKFKLCRMDRPSFKIVLSVLYHTLYKRRHIGNERRILHR